MINVDENARSWNVMPLFARHNIYIKTTTSTTTVNLSVSEKFAWENFVYLNGMLPENTIGLF